MLEHFAIRCEILRLQAENLWLRVQIAFLRGRRAARKLVVWLADGF